MQAADRKTAEALPDAFQADKAIYVGIDPGKHGALACLMPDGRIRAWHTPVTVDRHKHQRKKTKAGKAAVTTKTRYCPRLMLLLLAQAKKAAKKSKCPIVVCLERQWPRPTDSKHVIQVFAEGYATWTTLIGLLSLKLVEVSPSAWKPRYVRKEATKDDSIKICRKLYPRLPLPRKKDECIAEAVLIADYVRRRDLNLDYPRKRPPIVRRDKKETTAEQDLAPRKRASGGRKVSALFGRHKKIR